MAMSKEDTAINFRTDMCVICGKISEKSTDELITVRTKGLETLIHYSLLRQNERLQKYLETRPYVVKVHAQCRKDYTRARGLVLSSDKSTDDQPPAKKLRSQSDAFSWKRDCFFVLNVFVLMNGIILWIIILPGLLHSVIVSLQCVNKDQIPGLLTSKVDFSFA